MTSKYNTFNDVKPELLRAWNRAAMFYNIMADRSKAEAQEYILNFSKEEIVEVYSIFKEVELNGYEATRAYISRVVQNETVQ